MGSFGSDFIIYIREQDGLNSMFAAGDLRAKLFRCLSYSGVEHPEDSADDIALAVEYSLINRQQGIIDRGELDAAVIRLLEETGFPEAAVHYRNDGGFEEELLPATESAVSELFRRRISFTDSELKTVCADVIQAAQKLDISEASPHLFLELARHFSRRSADTERKALQELPLLDTEKLEKLPENVSGSTLKLMETRVISIEGLTAIFPCVRFHVSMQEFCRFFDVTSPVTELLVYPSVNQVASALEECRTKLSNGSKENTDLPCTLTIHDLRQFVREAFECSSELAIESLSSELANLFISGNTDFFKLDFD